MRWINTGRRCGKSYMMIISSYTTGIPIVVSNMARKDVLLRQAKEMGFPEIDVYTLHEWTGSKYTIGAKIYDKVLIDEAQEFVEKALEGMLNCEVVSATMTVPMIKRFKGGTNDSNC